MALPVHCIRHRTRHRTRHDAPPSLLSRLLHLELRPRHDLAGGAAVRPFQGPVRCRTGDPVLASFDRAARHQPAGGRLRRPDRRQAHHARLLSAARGGRRRHAFRLGFHLAVLRPDAAGAGARHLLARQLVDRRRTAGRARRAGRATERRQQPRPDSRQRQLRLRARAGRIPACVRRAVGDGGRGAAAGSGHAAAAAPGRVPGTVCSATTRC